MDKIFEPLTTQPEVFRLHRVLGSGNTVIGRLKPHQQCFGSLLEIRRQPGWKSNRNGDLVEFFFRNAPIDNTGDQIVEQRVPIWMWKLLVEPLQMRITGIEEKISKQNEKNACPMGVVLC